MTTDTSVVYFDSTMSGAPTLSNTAGSLITLLDACLVTGFGSVTLNNLVVASNVATATVSTGHNFPLVGATGMVVRIAGATPAELNGDWRIQSATGTTFTFTTSGIANQTATGTITAQRKPAGFSKAFSGTNKAAYRSDALAGTRLFMRIDDTGTTNARIRGYETMSDVDTGTGLFPTDAQISGGGYLYKATSTNRPWKLMSDGRLIYFFCDPVNTNAWEGGFVFGDIDSYASPDAYSNLLILSPNSNQACFIRELANASGAYFARSYTQLGGSLASAKYSHGRASGLGQAGQAYPAPVDNSLHLWPVEVWEGTDRARGMMPGLWNPIHGSTTPHGLVADDIPNLPGRTVIVQTTGTASYECAIDLTGPWRS